MKLTLTLICLFISSALLAQTTYIRDNVGRVVEVHYQNGTTILYNTDAGGGRVQRIIAPNILLPVEFVDFDAKKHEEQTTLVTWQVTGNTAGNYFIVEHSLDGSSFREVGRVTSTSSEKYSFIHTEPTLGAANYYRLKQVEVSGEESYTQVKVVYFDISENQDIQYTIYPNPTDGHHVIVEFTTDVAQYNPVFTLLDMKGIKFPVKAIKISSNKYEIEVLNIANAVYLLYINSDKGMFPTQKLVVRK